MIWTISYRADPIARDIADRHYNRQSIGHPQFVPPGRCVVLLAHSRRGAGALWVTSWPYTRFVKHAWAGAWVCSAFRNEGAGLSSTLIRDAVAATRAIIGEPPPLGMVTFVRADQVREKQDPGYCFLRAGFERCGETGKGYLAFRLAPQEMPTALAPLGIIL